MHHRLAQLTALAIAAATGTAIAQTRLVVGTGSGEYRTIQSAVDAAKSGDLILIKPGVYNAFVVQGKALRILGGGTGAQPSVRVDGTITLRDIASGTTLVSRIEEKGLSAQRVAGDLVLNLILTGSAGLDITSCRDVRASDVRTGSIPLVVTDSRLTLVASSLADGLAVFGLKSPAAQFERSHVVFAGVTAKGDAAYPTIALKDSSLELFSDGLSEIINRSSTTACISGERSTVVVDTDSAFGVGRTPSNSIVGATWSVRAAGIVGAGPADLGSDMLVLFGKDTSESWVLLFGAQGPYVDLGFGGTDLGIGAIVGVLGGGPGSDRLTFSFPVPNVTALSGIHLSWQGATIQGSGLTLTNVSTSVIQGTTL
ncbi:MAG: hypothetical protein KDC95_04960 [Planctomycetes bacterium]|nr:hypothetical protein [Planctomycetota bacterium]